MAVPNSAAAVDTAAQVCKRCKENTAAINMRAEIVCPYATSPIPLRHCLYLSFLLQSTQNADVSFLHARTCFTQFIAGKVVKRMEVLNRETKIPLSETKKLMIGLSFGPASSAMVRILNRTVHKHEAKKRRGGLVDYVVIHVDTSLRMKDSENGPKTEAEALLERYRAAFPEFPMHLIPLSHVMELENHIDWKNLPPLNSDLAREPERQLEDMISRLPSTTSRADIMRLFVRHILIDEAVQRSCTALLLGHTTTALAETTLAEAAKGRGFAVPWLVADGDNPVPVAGLVSESVVCNGKKQGSNTQHNEETELLPSTSTTIPVYYPLRDVFRKEVLLFNGHVMPPLTPLVQQESRSRGSSSTVVSHKNLSIEDIMRRYFVHVEENYPSIVANVVRTSTKLGRPGFEDNCAAKTTCGLCGLGLDKLGDERWRGEIGRDRADIQAESSKGLCYGCERSLRG